MASRKDEKQRLRAERERREEAAARSRRRRRRIQVIVGLVAAAAVVVVTAILIDRSGIKPSSDQALAGIPQKGPLLGKSTAPVVVTEYADFQCPVCRTFATDSLPAFIAKYVRSGKVRMEFKPIAILGEDSREAAAAAVAAGAQNRLWQFADNFYAHQGLEKSGYVTDGFLSDIAKYANLDVPAWEGSLSDPKWNATVDQNQKSAKKAGVTGTPTFIVKGPAGKREQSGALPAEQLGAMVDEVSGNASHGE